MEFVHGVLLGASLMHSASVVVLGRARLFAFWEYYALGGVTCGALAGVTVAQGRPVSATAWGVAAAAAWSAAAFLPTHFEIRYGKERP